MNLKVAIIPNEDYLTKKLVIELASAFPNINWFLLDIDRKDLKTTFQLNLEEEQLFKGIRVNTQFSNERFLEKQGWINNEISEIKPDVVFIFSAANYSYRCIRKAFPYQRIYVLQLALLKVDPQPSLLRVLQVKCRNFIKRAPVYAERPGFFQPHPNTLFGVWAEAVIPNFFQKRIRYKVVGNFNIDSALSAYERQKIKEIGAPLRAIYMTQPISLYYGIDSHKRNIEVIEQILNLNKGLKMTVKIHPRESKKLYETLFLEHPESVCLAKPDTELHVLLKEQDLLVTHYSTTIDTAVAMNIPVVCIDPDGKFKNYLPDIGVYVKVVKNGTDLDLSSPYFNNSHDREEERKLYLSRITGYLEGNSVQRIGESLLEFASSTERLV